MDKIEKAFHDAYKKRSFLWSMLLFPPIVLFSMKLSGYFLSFNTSLVLTATITALLIFGRNIHLNNSKIYKKLLFRALYKKEEFDEFVSSVEYEMCQIEAKTKTFLKEKIFICITGTWFVLITPNGSLICKRGDIKEITSTFRETNSKCYLKFTFIDEQFFQLPYYELEELLSDWNQI